MIRDLSILFLALMMSSFLGCNSYENPPVAQSKKQNSKILDSSTNSDKIIPIDNSKENISELLGVDKNSNGIRDDVESYIMQRFSSEEFPVTKIAIALQYAKATQHILKNPTIQNSKYENDAISCKYYWISKKTKNLSISQTLDFIAQNEIFDDEFDDIIYNSQIRVDKKLQYNRAISGHILNSNEISVDKCTINIDNLGQ